MTKTFEELRRDPMGTVYVDEQRGELRCIIARGLMSLCAYVGLPMDHPLAQKHRNEIQIEVHGGFSFCEEGSGEVLPKGTWLYGWDYAHVPRDNIWIPQLPMGPLGLPPIIAFFDHILKDAHGWTVEEVHFELDDAAEHFANMVKLESLLK